MRDYAGSPFTRLEPEIRAALSPIDYFLRDISRGMARIQNGEVPDGSGNQIVPTDGPFLFKPGLAGGQIAHGGANSGEQLELHSNTAFDGLILLGSSSAYDEANGRLGIGATAPLAVLHLAQPSSTPLLAASDNSLGGATPWGVTGGDGTATTALQTNDAGTTVVFINNAAGGTYNLRVNMPDLDPSVELWTVRLWARQSDEFSPGGSPFSSTLTVKLRDSSQDVWNSSALLMSSVALSGSYSAIDFTIDASGTPSGDNLGAGTDSRIELSFLSSASYQITFRVTLMEVFAGTPGGASNLTNWYTQAGSVLTSWVDESAVFHAPQYNLVDASGDEGALVPATLSADRTWTFPNSTGTVALLEATQTFTGANTFGTGNLFVIDETDGSFPIRYEVGGNNIFALDNAVSGFMAFAAGFAFYPDGDVGVGNFGTIGSVALTGNRTWNFPNVSITVAGLTATQTFTASTLGVGCVLISSTASSGVSFTDTTTSTKKLRMVLSGAVGNNSQTYTNTAARNYGFGNLSGNVVIVGDDPPAVASGSLGKVDLTAQTANIGTTALSSTPPAGLYAVEVYIATTTNDVTAGTLAVVIGWTDVVGATTANAVAAHTLAATGRSTGRQLCQVASGDLTYAVTITGGYGTSAYAVYVRVVSLG